MRDLGKIAHCCRNYVMKTVKELEKENLVVNMSGVWCGTLVYADDIVLNRVMSYRRWLEDRQICGSPELRVRQWWWDKRTVVRSGEFVTKRLKKQVCGIIGKSMEIYNMIEKDEEWASKLEWMAIGGWGIRSRMQLSNTEVLTRCSLLRLPLQNFLGSILPTIKL